MKVLLLILTFNAFALTNAERSSLKSRVEAAVNRINNQERSTRLNDQEFIISMYQQILQATPDFIDFKTAELLLAGDDDHPAINRSNFIEQLITRKSGEDTITWEVLEKEIDLLENLNLVSRPSYGIYLSSREEDTSRKKKKYLEPIAHRGEYQPYYGYLHAHSELSDGRGQAIEAYTMAKQEAKLDYFALTDHSEFLHFWPWERKYKKLRQIADEFNEDGKFAALYGFEWSHPILGHFNIVNTKKFTSAIITPTMRGIMRWLSKRDGGFGRFNHPGRHNLELLPIEFRKLKVYNRALEEVVGIELWNKDKGIRSYLNEGSYMEGVNFLDNANLKGWFVGAMGGQDNHDKDWGLRNDYRVGVWLESLNRQNVVDGYFARRTFATEDKNAWVSFKIDGAQMGSRLTPGNYTYEIEFGDSDDEIVTHIKLINKGELIEEYQLGENQKITGELTGSVDDFFYVIAEQADGNMLISSPIWFVPYSLLP